MTELFYYLLQSSPILLQSSHHYCFKGTYTYVW